MPTPSPARVPPLSHPQSQEVLRYWLAAVRLEEALGSRPKARKTRGGQHTPNVETPAPGQDYFKLPLDTDVQATIDRSRNSARDFDPELCGFFEDWLYNKYRSGETEVDGGHLLCFPVVHLARGELTGLLRRNVELRFTDSNGTRFKVPSRPRRRKKQFPPSPTTVAIHPATETQGDWPFFIDTRLLHRQLGLSTEAIDALFEQLRDTDRLTCKSMLNIVTGALEADLADYPGAATATPQLTAPTSPPASPETSTTERLVAAIGSLLARQGGRARVYPFSIVVDGNRAKTTFHLQQDFATLLRSQSPGRKDLTSPLAHYLAGRINRPGRAVHRALFTGPDLTQSQTDAAEAVWGSNIVAVQGPPGTGKTTLIQHLCAEHLVRQVEAIVDHGALGEGPLLVASSNNRAVDNVIDPLVAAAPHTDLGGEGCLPFALRLGSRKVCEQVLAPQLRRAALWLSSAASQSQEERDHELRAATEHFSTIRSTVNRAYAPRSEAFTAAVDTLKLEAELAALMSAQSTSSDQGGPPNIATQLDPKTRSELLANCQALHNRLTDLSDLCDAKPSLTTLNTVARNFERIQKKHLAQFESDSQAAQLPSALGLPPALPASIEPTVLLDAWQTATEEALCLLDGIEGDLKAAEQQAALQRKRRQLEQQLQEQEPAEKVPTVEVSEESRRELFRSAVQLRESWAAANAERLAPMVENHLHAATEQKSLRAIARDDPEEFKLFQRLFGVWGSTLLSIGNCLAPHLNAIPKLVIDEAGQCHPAHAVSGLLRARSALIIGDVNQLTPVIELGPDEERRALQSAQVKMELDTLNPYRAHSECQISTQSVADRTAPTPLSLIEHFRCQPEIIAISNRLCEYGLDVRTLPASRTAQARFLEHPVSLLHTRGTQERLGGSWYNADELAVTLQLLQTLLARGISAADIAVITPYRGQLERLRRQCTQFNIPLEPAPELLEFDGPTRTGTSGLAIGTVHRFQGGERSVVIFSAVISRPQSLTFLDARPNLLNVAVSRARHHLICVGDGDVLAQGRRTRHLTDAAKPLSLADVMSG